MVENDWSISICHIGILMPGLVQSKQALPSRAITVSLGETVKSVCVYETILLYEHDHQQNSHKPRSRLGYILDNRDNSYLGIAVWLYVLCKSSFSSG